VIERFTNVPVPADTLYFAVKVLLPAVRPVTNALVPPWTTAVPPRVSLGLATENARASVAATVVAPETAKLMKDVPPPKVLFVALPEIKTSALPEAGIVTVAAGPTVVRST
jgi:hypothetical protein